MRTSDLLSLAFTNLWRRKLRTFLTVLGVIIGCTSIIIMVSFGLAQRKQMDDFMGDTANLQTIEVISTSSYDPRSGERMPRKGLITEKTIKEIEGLDNVESVIAGESLDPYYIGTQIELGKYDYMENSIVGYDAKALEDLDLKITEGRMLDVNSRDIEVIASSAAMFMPKDGDFNNFDPKDVKVLSENGEIRVSEDGGVGPMGFPGMTDQGSESGPMGTGQTKKYRFKIVGIYEGSMMDASPKLIASKENIEKINGEINEMAKIPPVKEKTYRTVKVNMVDPNLKDQTQEDIQALDLDTMSNADFIEGMNKVAGVMQAILGGIGGISLVVAAIGITNSMVMSVYERTKEIGVMKVIGAKVSDIRNLFLLEAGLMGLFGGLAGLALSLAISAALNAGFAGLAGGEGELISIITPKLAIGALLICFIIGLLTGYYPAVRATRLSALEAIRTE